MAMLLDKAACSAELSVSQKTLERWVAQGIVPQPVRIGGVVRWKYDDIKACVQKMGQEDTQEGQEDTQEKPVRRGRPRLAV